MKRPTCFWHRGPAPGNLGDALAPVILAGLGFEVSWAGRGEADMVSTGSVIDSARTGTVVWGSGAMSAGSTPSPDAQYFAVRGPLTAWVVSRRGGKWPTVYGDPALLLPAFHARPVAKRHDCGFVPHYASAFQARPGAHVISPLNADALEVVDEIRSCRSIVSSSLHGLVVAQAYGIPWRWAPAAGLKGDGLKFHDFAASVGVALRPLQDSLGTFDPQPLLSSLEDVKEVLA